jgi:hypothetical protein
MPVQDLIRHWKYKQCGEKSVASLRRAGLITISKDRAHFLRYPEEIEPRVTMKTYTPEQLRELDDLSRRNLLYLYQDELAKYQDGAVPVGVIPQGVRRSLQHLGVLKWKILELTDLGRRLLGEVLSRTAPPMQQSSIGY